MVAAVLVGVVVIHGDMERQAAVTRQAWAGSYMQQEQAQQDAREATQERDFQARFDPHVQPYSSPPAGPSVEEQIDAQRTQEAASAAGLQHNIDRDDASAQQP